MDFCVVIPTYNAAHTLEQAVESALHQTHLPAEIVVVDDGSTDETATLMSRYAGRIRYIRLPHCGLPAVARNRGIAETQAEFVAFLDADDWWYSHHLEAVRQAFTRRRTAGICYGNYVIVNKQGQRIRRVRSRAIDGDGFRALLLYGFIDTSTTVVRRACLEHVGLFSELEELAGCEDWELWLRIARHYPLVHVAEALVYYRVHDSNISLSSSDRWLRSFQAMRNLVIGQVDDRERACVIAWHDFFQARFHLKRGQMDEARRLIDKSLKEFPALDRRWLFWSLTRTKWALRLPDALRQRLGIAKQLLHSKSGKL